MKTLTQKIKEHIAKTMFGINKKQMEQLIKEKLHDNIRTTDTTGTRDEKERS